MFPALGVSDATTGAGFALTLCAAAMWAMSNIAVQRVQQLHNDYSPVAFVVWSSSVAIVPFMALSLTSDAPDTRWQWLGARGSSWLAVAYLGWVGWSGDANSS